MKEKVIRRNYGPFKKYEWHWLNIIGGIKGSLHRSWIDLKSAVLPTILQELFIHVS